MDGALTDKDHTRVDEIGRVEFRVVLVRGQPVNKDSLATAPTHPSLSLLALARAGTALLPTGSALARYFKASDAHYPRG